MDVSLQQSYRTAKDWTRTHAKTFYFASHFLPSGKRRHAYALYALCRHLDDQVDRAGVDVAEVCRGLRELVADIFEGEGSRGPGWLAAFRDTVRVCGIRRGHVEDLVTGMEMDRGRVRIGDWGELERYCYHVAGVVGLMMMRVLGLEDPESEPRAVDLGNAMQLTNILRDVGEDLGRDRIYLPADELAGHGLDEAAVRAGVVTPHWRDFLRMQIGRARMLYRRAEEGIMRLPDDGSRRTVWVMRDVYAGILRAVEEADYGVFDRRCHVGFFRKCALVWDGWQCRSGGGG